MTRTEWNAMVVNNMPQFGAFLQSWEWGQFQEMLGRDVKRLCLLDGQLIAQAVRMPLPAGQYYWYIPKGPLGDIHENDAVSALRAALPGGMFLRLEPTNACTLKKVGDFQTRATTRIELLDRTEEEILMAMKSKTRYNIRLAKRKGVEMRFIDPREHFDDFMRLMNQMKVRTGITIFPESYYQLQLEALQGPDVHARMAAAFYEGIPIAINTVIDFHDTRVYLHGATSNLYRNVSGQYGLHFYLMEDARRQGIKYFDFWGVAPQGSNEKESWEGITKYKMGYGGEYQEMPGTYDLPLKHLWYGAYRTFKKIRK